MLAAFHKKHGKQALQWGQTKFFLKSFIKAFKDEQANKSLLEQARLDSERKAGAERQRNAVLTTPARKKGQPPIIGVKPEPADEPGTKRAEPVSYTHLRAHET